jgi:lysophospholipase L1-like esterase
MWGFASTSPTDGAYTQYNSPYYSQQDLQGIYGSVVTVSDQGVGATTLNQLISGSDGKHAAWAKQMQSSTAQIVIVNHGLNDDVVGETLDTYRALLIEFVSTARQYGKTPVLEEPNPSCDPQRANLGDYVKVMDHVAAEMNVPLISQWAYIQTLPNWQSYFADCIHPNPAMYQIKAQREAVVLSPLVAKLL